MTKTAVYLVGKDDLFREGLKSLLVKNDFTIAGEYDSATDMPKDQVVPNDVTPLIINIDGDAPDAAEKLLKVKSSYARSRLIIVSSRTEMPSIMPAFSAGIDGYILKDISCPALLGSLRLVVAGEKVYPTFMLGALSKQIDNPAANDTGNGKVYNGHQLSRQEMRIIGCLANGDPNKIIAHNLSISETTVKVHVKTILRKLGAKNRTQAALWATAHGLAEPLKHMQLRMNV